MSEAAAQTDAAAGTGPVQPLGPVAPRERIALIDVLRGFALFGVFLVNMPLFNTPIYLAMSKVRWFDSTADHVVELLTRLLFQGKFIATFSFLFGLGLSIQLERAEGRGRSSARLFGRRMLWLLLIGLVHAFLIWYGDILVIYALMGLVMIAFRKRRSKTLMIWAGVLLLIPLLLFGLAVGAVQLGKTMPEAREEIAAQLADSDERIALAIEEARAAYAEGSLADVLAQRSADVGQIYSYSLMFCPFVLAMFLIGLETGRRKILHNAAFHAPQLRRALPWLLGIGAVFNLLMVVTQEIGGNPSRPSGWNLLGQVGFTFGVPALALGYVSVVALLYQGESWRPRLAPLGAVGRMALTNYLSQSVICTALFNSHGLGLYGTVSPWQGLVLTLVIFALQIVFSGWWLGRFRYGPMEWVWRSLTYGRLQPMRRAAQGAV